MSKKRSKVHQLLMNPVKYVRLREHLNSSATKHTD